jgi:hypothetical protein
MFLFENKVSSKSQKFSSFVPVFNAGAQLPNLKDSSEPMNFCDSVQHKVHMLT